MKQNREQENYGKKQKEKLKRQLKMKFANSLEHYSVFPYFLESDQKFRF